MAPIFAQTSAMQPLGTFTIDQPNGIMTYDLVGAPPIEITIDSIAKATIRGPRATPRFDFTKQDGWGNAAPPATGLPDFLPDRRNYAVKIWFKKGDPLEVPMGAITNKGTWVNTEAGAIIAKDEIMAAIV